MGLIYPLQLHTGEKQHDKLDYKQLTGVYFCSVSTSQNILAFKNALHQFMLGGYENPKENTQVNVY